MGDKTRGLYPEGKFIVRRKDGTDAPGGKHDGCEYFVLDMTHDPHARSAILAYAQSCEADYPLLAADLHLAWLRDAQCEAVDALSAPSAAEPQPVAFGSIAYKLGLLVETMDEEIAERERKKLRGSVAVLRAFRNQVAAIRDAAPSAAEPKRKRKRKLSGGGK